MQDFEKEYKLFQEALDIQYPWYIDDYKLVKNAGQFHVFLDFERGAKFSCPRCGSTHNRVHDILNEDRMWRHKDFWQYQTYLHARMPRIKCETCNKVITIEVDWSRPGAGFTYLFETEVMQLMKEMPVAAVARQVGEHDTRLWRVFHYYVQKSMDELDLSNIRRIAIDETSSRRGHRYVTLFVDVDTKRVIFATEGKDASVIETFKQHLLKKGVQPDAIEDCCCDMSPAFIKGIETAFPKAHITFDKFHVMKMVNEAVDQVRRQEQQHQPLLKKTRYLWLKNKENLSSHQTENLLKLKDSDLKTAKAYRLRLSLQALWSTHPVFAGWYFDEWYTWAIRSRLEPMINVARSLKAHENGILRWFTTRMTNGLLEGINSLVQASKRKARGYRSLENFLAMIYATANKFSLNVKPQA